MGIEYNDYLKTEAWRQRAEAAKARAGQRCQICNRAAPRVTLTVHHRTFERLGQEQPEDLTVLCRSCYELYDKNRRMPSPPADQPTAPVTTTDKPARPRRPALAPASSPRFFAPARAGHRHTALNGQNGHNGQPDELLLPLPTNTIYRLATDVQSAEDASFFDLSPTAEDSPAADVYQLAVAAEDSPLAPPTPQPVHWRGAHWGLVTVVVLAILILLGLSDWTPDLSALFSQQAASNLVATTPLDTAPAAVATVTAPVVAPTVAPTVATTMTPVLPTMTPTPLSPTPTNVPPTVVPTVALTPTALPPTVTSAPLSSVLRTALVCQNPCTCAPIVRTIPQGTQVTVQQTQACGGDVWYQIGENEWLGPGVIDVK